jgi:hypothetical protein
MHLNSLLFVTTRFTIRILQAANSNISHRNKSISWVKERDWQMKLSNLHLHKIINSPCWEERRKSGMLYPEDISSRMELFATPTLKG